nr:hypothetical protein [Tanacetum cinerariifolium]
MLDTVGAEMQVVKKNEKDLSIQKDNNVILTPHNGQQAFSQFLHYSSANSWKWDLHSSGSGNLYCQWELSPGSGNAFELSKKVDLLLRNLGKGVLNVSQVSHDACLMMTTITIALAIPNNKTMVTNKGMRVVIYLTSNKITNNKDPTNKGSKYQNQGQGLSNGQQSNVDQKFNLILSELAKSNQDANLKFESLSKSVMNLERKMGQVAEEVHKREAGKLPSYPTLNPKHKIDGPEHVNMVTSLRSGKTYKNDIKCPSVRDFSHDVEDFVTDDEIVVEDKKADDVQSDSELVNDLLKYFPKPPTQNPEAAESPKVREGGMSSTSTPYPVAFEKSTSASLVKKGPHSEDMWETFKQVKINLPFIDAIKQIPAYSKFLKGLMYLKEEAEGNFN